MSKATTSPLLAELQGLYSLAIGINNFLELIHTEMSEDEPEQETNHCHFIGMVRTKTGELQERLYSVISEVANGTHGGAHG